MEGNQMPADYHPNQLLNEQSACELLGYSVRTLQKWRVVGGGPKFVKVSARSVRYRVQDLLDWTAERTVTSTSDQGCAA